MDKVNCLWCWIYTFLSHIWAFPMAHGLASWSSGKEFACQSRRCWRREFDLWVKKIPWRRKWQPIPVFLLRKSHGQRNLAGYSWKGPKETWLKQLSSSSSVDMTQNLKRRLASVCLDEVLYFLNFFRILGNRYSWALNNTGLNCLGPLICRFFP